MKKACATFLFVMFSISFVQTAQAAYAMRFDYVPNEGDGWLKCTHQRILDLPDWKVECGDAPVGQNSEHKSLEAHVVVRKADRPHEPETLVEIIYWVIEPGDTPTSVHKFHSTSMLLDLKNKTDIASVILYLGIEEDRASLRLQLTEITP